MRLHVAGRGAGGCGMSRAQVWRRGGLGTFGVFGVFGECPKPAPSPQAPRDPRWATGAAPNWRHHQSGGQGHFCRAALAGQGSYRWEHGQSRLNSWKPQTSREEGKWHVPSAPHFPIFINNRKRGCLDKRFYLQSK